MVKYFTFLTFLFFCQIGLSQDQYIKKYDNGKIHIKASIKDNILYGLYEEFYPNGNVKATGYYSDCDSELNGSRILLIDRGSKNQDGFYSGKKDGVWKFYYENGKIENKSNHHCGIQDGLEYSYYEDGTLEYIELYRINDIEFSKEFDKNGFLIISQYYTYVYNPKESTDIISLIEYEFYSNGRLKKSREVKGYDSFNEKEYYIKYNEKGFRIEEKTLTNDKRNGICRIYYTNGKIKNEAVYKDDYPKGKMYFYDREGTIVKIEFWRNKKLIRTKFENK